MDDIISVSSLYHFSDFRRLLLRQVYIFWFEIGMSNFSTSPPRKSYFFALPQCVDIHFSAILCIYFALLSHLPLSFFSFPLFHILNLSEIESAGRGRGCFPVHRPLCSLLTPAPFLTSENHLEAVDFDTVAYHTPCGLNVPKYRACASLRSIMPHNIDSLVTHVGEGG
jgi:hypothetical protein